MYPALYAGYAAAALALWGAAAVRPALWPRAVQTPNASLPLWRTLAIIISVLALGQVYQAGLMLPEHTTWRDAARLANQLLIFLPVFAVVAVSMHDGDETVRGRAFVPRNGIAQRLAIGCAVAAIATFVFLTVRPDAARLSTMPARLLASPNAAHAAQILGEDFAMGLILASAVRHVGPKAAVIAAGSLFAAGHIPTMVAQGAPLADFPALAADAGLAAGMMALVLRLRDLWPIWPVHVAMDLMQFYGGR